MKLRGKSRRGSTRGSKIWRPYGTLALFTISTQCLRVRVRTSAAATRLGSIFDFTRGLRPGLNSQPPLRG